MSAQTSLFANYNFATAGLSPRESVTIQKIREHTNPRTEERLIGLALLFLRSLHFVLKPGPSPPRTLVVRSKSVPSTPRGDALEAHIVRNCVVIINVKHTPLHADHFVAVVGAPVILPALKITVEAALIFTGKTLVLLPIIAVAAAITVPICPPIPIPIAVPIPFPPPIAVAVPASTAVGGHIALRNVR